MNKWSAVLILTASTLLVGCSGLRDISEGAAEAKAALNESEVRAVQAFVCNGSLGGLDRAATPEYLAFSLGQCLGLSPQTVQAVLDDRSDR